MTVVTIGSGKGGVAKSRVATQLAVCAVVDGVDAALMDTDQQGSSMSWVRIRDENKIEPPIRVIPLSDKVSERESEKPSRKVIELSRRYDLVILDIAANSYQTFFECAGVSDVVIVPCGNDQQEMEATLQVFDDFARMKERGREVRAIVLLTRVAPRKKKPGTDEKVDAKSTRELREAFQAENIKVMKATLPMRSAWVNTGKTGRALHELASKDRSPDAEAEMLAVYNEVKKLAAKKEW
jgi:chromosome partitioning protein